MPLLIRPLVPRLKDSDYRPIAAKSLLALSLWIFCLALIGVGLGFFIIAFDLTLAGPLGSYARWGLASFFTTVGIGAGYFLFYKVSAGALISSC